jgi:hypothetical protein
LINLHLFLLKAPSDLPGFYFTCHQANENKESKEEILGFMKTADIGIEDFVVSKETAEEAKISDIQPWTCKIK